MIRQHEHIIVQNEFSTFHTVEKMYYKHIALYLLESDIDTSYCVIVDENMNVLQHNVKTFADFALDEVISKNFDESIFVKLEKQVAFLNQQCKDDFISYDELTERVNAHLYNVLINVSELLNSDKLNALQAHFIYAILQAIANDAFKDIESVYAELNEESDNENY